MMYGIFATFFDSYAQRYTIRFTRGSRCLKDRHALAIFRAIIGLRLTIIRKELSSFALVQALQHLHQFLGAYLWWMHTSFSLLLGCIFGGLLWIDEWFRQICTQ